MSGHPVCIAKLLELAQDSTTPGFTRLKAIEGLGRLRATAASQLLEHIMEAKQLWRYSHSDELRIAAAQALMRIDPSLALEKLAPSGLDRKDLTLEPTDPDPNASVIRQRRYARLKLSRNVAAVSTNLRENIRLTIPELNLGGGIGAGDRHLAPGSMLSLKFTSRCARHQGAGCGARCPASGHGVRIRRYGSRRARQASQNAARIWRAADGGSSNESYAAAWPRGDAEKLAARFGAVSLLLSLSQWTRSFVQVWRTHVGRMTRSAYGTCVPLPPHVGPSTVLVR